MERLILHQTRAKDGSKKPKQIGIAFWTGDRTKRVLKKHFVAAKGELGETVTKNYHRGLEHGVGRFPAQPV